MRMAGSALRLNRSDLMKLLEDEEGGTNTNEFLDIPLQNVETAGTSGVVGSFLSKGRGNVLGYQKGGSPTVEYRGPAESIREVINAPRPTSSSAESTGPGKYQGVAQGVNINDPSGIYGVGFGPGDLRRALDEGYSSQSIRDYLTSSYQGSPISEDVARSLGMFQHPGGIVTENKGTVTNLTAPKETTISPPPQKTYSGVAGGVNIHDPSGIYGVGFGPGDLRRAQQEGYSNESIKQYLSQSYGGKPISEDVRRQLGM
jgi:hypothetical protein